MKINKVLFEKSSSSIGNCPKNGFFEIAFIGRSNVGKSSILNMLLNRKGIAKVSKKPGKTKLINFFFLNEKIYFVDLPGYGYSKLSKKNKLKISSITETYFKHRESLKEIFLLIDIRHEIQIADLEFINFLKSIKRDFTIVFTKKDKIKDSLVKISCDDFLKSITNIYKPNKYFVSSSKSKYGREEILDYIGNMIS